MTVYKNISIIKDNTLCNGELSINDGRILSMFRYRNIINTYGGLQGFVACHL